MIASMWFFVLVGCCLTTAASIASQQQQQIDLDLEDFPSDFSLRTDLDDGDDHITIENLSPKDLRLKLDENAKPKIPVQKVPLPKFDYPMYAPEDLNDIMMSLDRADNEILCNCTEGQSCGLGRFANICRTKGGCSAQLINRNWKQPDAEPDNFFSLSCVERKIYAPRAKPFTCQVADGNRHHQDIRCCHSHDFCTSDVTFTLVPRPVQAPVPQAADDAEPWTYVLLGLIALLIIAMLVAGYVVLRRLRQLKIPDEKEPFLMEEEKNRMDNLKVLQNLLAEAAGEYTNSGSGSGLPVLVQRTIARQIELQGKHPIGTGRFGEVWLGLWKGEKVAVKIFHSFEEKSWFREVEIYQTNMLRHTNIVGFIASDNKDTGVYTQLWLVTEYHALGSLYDYLLDNSLDVRTLAHMVETTAAGLSFLHAEIEGTHCKPAIAHRDLKSKNILVKSDLTCCIADLGMAVRYSNQVLELPSGSRVGTRRYLAPEVLDGSLQEQQFDAYRRADIYSFGLCIWECLRRTSVNGTVFTYELPYFEEVGTDPSQEDMHAVVCEQRCRPPLDAVWHEHPMASTIGTLMEECWRPNATARLTALRVRKTVAALLAKADEQQSASYSNQMSV